MLFETYQQRKKGGHLLPNTPLLPNVLAVRCLIIIIDLIIYE